MVNFFIGHRSAWFPLLSACNLQGSTPLSFATCWLSLFETKIIYNFHNQLAYELEISLRFYLKQTGLGAGVSLH